jgi:hypothetical protein
LADGEKLFAPLDPHGLSGERSAWDPRPLLRVARRTCSHRRHGRGFARGPCDQV